MKLPVRWITTWFAASGVVLGSVLSISGAALALSEAEIAQRLSGVPVFMIARADGDVPGRCLNPANGKPIGCDSPDKVVVTIAFMDQQEAQAALSKLQESSPEQVSGWKIIAPTLQEVREKTQSARQKGEPMVISFRPAQSQLNAAMRILRQQNPQTTRFQGVPLFFAVAPNGNSGQSTFLSAQLANQNQPVIPFFFSRADLEKKLNENPALAAKYQIRVMAFEQLIQLWQNPQAKEPWLERVQLFPASSGN